MYILLSKIIYIYIYIYISNYYFVLHGEVLRGFKHNFKKKVAFKIFTIFIGKHLCWNLSLIKLQAFKPATLLKRGSNTSVFL